MRLPFSNGRAHTRARPCEFAAESSARSDGHLSGNRQGHPTSVEVVVDKVPPPNPLVSGVIAPASSADPRPWVPAAQVPAQAAPFGMNLFQNNHPGAEACPNISVKSGTHKVQELCQTSKMGWNQVWGRGIPIHSKAELGHMQPGAIHRVRPKVGGCGPT